MRLKWLRLICVYIVINQALAHPRPTEIKDNGEKTEVDPVTEGAPPSKGQGTADTNSGNGTSSEFGGGPSASTTKKPNRVVRSLQTTRPTPPPPPPPQKPTICTISTNYYDCQIHNVQLMDNEARNFGLSDRANLQTTITFRESRLAYLPKSLMDAFPRMNMLNVADLQIRKIQPRAFETTEDITTIYLQNNLLEEIRSDAFAKAYNLSLLELSRNQISHIDYGAFNDNQQLQRLYLNENRLRTLPMLNGNVELYYLNVSHNKLTILNNDFNEHQSLKTVDLSHNSLMELFIPGKVEKLFASYNNIKSIHFNICVLTHLRLSHNNLKRISIPDCANLELLDLSFNQLEEFTFKQSHVALTTVKLSNNNLFEINALPSSLISLELSNNKLSFLPKKSNLNLELLWLDNNHFIDFEFRSAPKLKSIRLANNDWSCKSIETVQNPSSIEDRGSSTCNDNFISSNSVCCRNYLKPYTDVLKEALKETSFHEQILRDSSCKNRLSKNVNSQDAKNDLRQAISNAGEKKKPVLELIEKAKTVQADVEKQIEKIRKSKHTAETKIAAISRYIEITRREYGVTTEGPLGVHLVFERVVKFPKDRNANNTQLLERRDTVKKATISRINDLQKDVDDTEQIVIEKKKDLRNFKAEELKLKKEKQKLEKIIQKPSPSLRGSG